MKKMFMLRLSKENTLAKALVFSAVFVCIFVSSHLGNWWGLGLDGHNNTALLALRLGGALLLSFLFTCICAYLKAASNYHKLVFSTLFIYFGFLLSAVWPGYLMTDSRAAVVQGLNIPIHTWLGFFTPFFYSSVIQTVPHIAAISASQLIIAATIATYCVRVLDSFTGSRFSGILFLLIITLKPSFVFNVLLLSRDTLFSFLSLWACAFLLDQYMTRREDFFPLLAAGFLSAFLFVIRGDGIFVFIPLLICVTFLTKSKKGRAYYIGAAVVTSLLFATLLPRAVGKDDTDIAYKVANVVNPLGYILQSKYHVDPYNRLPRISKMVDLEKIKRIQNPYEIPAWWGGGLINSDFTKDDLSNFSKDAPLFILDNFGIYLAGRAELFSAATGFSDNAFRYADFLKNWIPGWGPPSSIGLGNERERPFPKLFETIDTLLEQSANYYGFAPKGSLLFWNFIPSLIVLFLATFLWSVYPAVAMASAVILFRALLVFLTAPASQYKYYLSVDLCGMFIFCLLLGSAVNRWRANKIIRSQLQIAR